MNVTYEGTNAENIKEFSFPIILALGIKEPSRYTQVIKLSIDSSLS
jgi:hypothetical protein